MPSPHARIVLLHGNPASMYDFARLAELLRDELEVVAIDLPGFGRSENVRLSRHESLLDTYARHVMAALDQLGWHEPFCLLGHSHGAGVAQAIAALFPERISRLVLIGSLGTPAHWGYRQLVAPGTLSALRVLAKTLKHTLPRWLRWRIIQAVMTPIFSPQPLAQRWIDEQLDVVENRPEILVTMALVAFGDPCAQLERNARKIVAPTLFMHGASDRLVPAVHARAIYEIVARSVRAEYYELPQVGHMLHISHPERVRELLFDWLARLQRSDDAKQAGKRTQTS
jgi:pimeloyl-ACP methyl ester carboxylesterase